MVLCILVPQFASLLAQLYLARPLLGATSKSKVGTYAPFYSLTWMIFDPMHSCATVRDLC